VAEWIKAAVLKTAVGLAPTVGSNPTLSDGSASAEEATWLWDENFSLTAARVSANW
jgi:hypothetical protein